MFGVKSNPTAETVGVAPKAAYPAAAALVIGIILADLDLSGLLDIEDEIWITLLTTGVGVFGIATASPAALQKAKDPADPGVVR